MRTLPSFFANSFGALDHFKVGCGVEESPQGLHLVILGEDAGLERGSPASSVPRVYYGPLTSPTLEVRLLSLSLIPLGGGGGKGVCTHG